jgi:hypothetical protein
MTRLNARNWTAFLGLSFLTTAQAIKPPGNNRKNDINHHAPDTFFPGAGSLAYAS